MLTKCRDVYYYSIICIGDFIPLYFFQLKREIAKEFNLVDVDVTVIVDNFIPGSTRAQVRISISEYYGITVDDITEKMNRLVDANFRIGRAAVLEVSGLWLRFALELWLYRCQISRKLFDSSEICPLHNLLGNLTIIVEVRDFCVRQIANFIKLSRLRHASSWMK